MSLLKTKPHYFPTAVATESGWTNPVTGEILVSIGGLKSKLALESENIIEPLQEKYIATTPTPVEVIVLAEPIVELEKEIVMEIEAQPKPRKEYTKKVKVIGEVTEHKIEPGKQLIGEVVEYNLDKTVIGE